MKINFKSPVVLILSLLIGFGVGSTVYKSYSKWYADNHYTPTSEASFINGCVGQGGTQSYCQCTLTKIKSVYTYKQMKFINDNYTTPEQLPPQVLAIADQCSAVTATTST